MVEWYLLEAMLMCDTKKNTTAYTMKVSMQKKFAVFTLFACPQNILYESSRWRYSSMDLRESMRDSAKVFHKGLHVQITAKLFCLKTFMVYGTCNVCKT